MGPDADPVPRSRRGNDGPVHGVHGRDPLIHVGMSAGVIAIPERKIMGRTMKSMLAMMIPACVRSETAWRPRQTRCRGAPRRGARRGSRARRRAVRRARRDRRSAWLDLAIVATKHRADDAPPGGWPGTGRDAALDVAQHPEPGGIEPKSAAMTAIPGARN